MSGQYQRLADVPLRIAIVGMGLIGGSVALALRGHPDVAELVGVDRDPEARETALALGAAHRVSHELQAVAGCHLVVVAVPVRSVVSVIRGLIPHCAPGTVITDVASTKAHICREVAAVLPPGLSFIGGHPMAGSERTGMGAADRYLFQNAVYVLTPGAGSTPEALGLVKNLVAVLGARPLIMAPEDHDQAVAVTSHLPHVAAAALVHALAGVAETLPDAYQLVAGGFRDTTRIAGGDPALWRDICLSNRKALLGVLDGFEAALRRFRRALEDGDGEGMEQAFAEAKAVRARLPLHTKGILGQVFDIVLDVVDRPGVISHVSTILARRGINIIDIEILRVREGEGGTLRLAFERKETMDEAVALLKAAGYDVRPRFTQ